MQISHYPRVARSSTEYGAGYDKSSGDTVGVFSLNSLGNTVADLRLEKTNQNRQEARNVTAVSGSLTKSQPRSSERSSAAFQCPQQLVSER